ncbi:Chemotaxis protein methyltransferase CheR [Fulvivirga imtechensis AK7]|uniref:Chemotaxis protein methyltransferase CheR n=1 Tax=Fulvivirga imtechensis AK7 TaxID=1237149 RepID=L8JQQ9_9BACT|nr:chemotaxis protein CheB [Fulvivirga imtechensis]ELR71281.1 Chemotaxis protein methyltransferase CheR [Fulvivirga imtechensis AK7]
MKLSKVNSVEYIVAIGASAGGLTPLQELVDSLPENIDNTAIIVAQHLSPEYKSMLAEIISRKTLLPATAITDGVELEPNHIYVTPPNCDAIVKGRHLEIMESSAGGPRPNIDRLFKSMAREYGKRAVGVVLSGTGKDGSKGIIELRKAGGLTLCQDLESCKYTGMPHAAISTGMVDLVLSPREIGENLVSMIYNRADIISSEEKVHDNEEHYGSSDDINTILDLLEAKMGTDFSNYKESTIIRRLEKRLHDKKFNSVEAYLKYIRNNDDELEEFFKYLLIGVTSFFRDTEAFDALKLELKELIKQKPGRSKLRVWVPGCATGEESVSIAILINELIAETGRYDIKAQIFATDINIRALKVARMGIYSKDKVEVIPKELVQKYFDKNDKEYEVSRDLKQTILYTKHDLTSNPPFLRLDMISCRNLFIYFNQRLQNHIFPIFQYSLLPGGILFLGKSETVGHYKNIFSTLNAKYRIFSRKDRGPLKPLRLPATKPLVMDKKVPSKLNLKNESLSIHEMVKETLYNTFEYPYVVIDENLDIVEVSGDTNSFLKIKSGLANMNLLRLIVEDLQIEVRALVMQAIKSMKIEQGGIRRYEDKGESHLVRIMVKPLIYAKPGHPYFMVIFESLDAVEPFFIGNDADNKTLIESQRNQELEYELISNKQHMNTLVEELETTNEELQALNEELQSSNEELQASNEELETSNEELQATNEELENAYVDLRLTTQKLSRQKQMWEKLSVTSPDHIAVLRGEDFIFEFVNPAYQALFPKRELEGHSVTSVMPELAAQGFIDLLSEVRSSGKPFHETEATVTMDYDGSGNEKTRYFNFTYAPLKYSDEDDPDIIIYAVDVTEHVRDRKKAENSAQFFSTLAESMAQKIWTVDPEGFISYINQTMRSYLCYEGEVKDLELSEYVHEDDIQSDAVGGIEALNAKEEHRKQYRLRDSQGVYRWHLIRNSPLINEKGDLVVWICTATDIHEQKTIEEKKDEFMSIASHELKTPLTTVKAYIELLEEVLKESDVETARLYTQKASAGLQRINSLVSDLLDVTRIQTGKLKFSISKLDFDKLVAQAVDNARPLTNNHEIIFEGKANAQIEGDANRLEQVMVNLIGNAIKYSNGADKVLINTYRENGHAVFEVVDFGPGIQPQYRSKIFERFYRLNQSHDYTSGLGIGLYISKQIISQHKGEIGVTDHENPGSKFYVKLPILK